VYAPPNQILNVRVYLFVTDSDLPDALPCIDHIGRGGSRPL